MSETSAVDDAGAAHGSLFESHGPVSRVAASRATVTTLAPRVVGQRVRAA